MSYLYFNDPSDNYEFVISKIKTSLNKNLIIETDNNNIVLDGASLITGLDGTVDISGELKIDGLLDMSGNINMNYNKINDIKNQQFRRRTTQELTQDLSILQDTSNTYILAFNHTLLTTSSYYTTIGVYTDTNDNKLYQGIEFISDIANGKTSEMLYDICDNCFIFEESNDGGSSYQLSNIRASDASFGNVDISGTLNINGSSGDTGAVLTSQGTSNPTWERPYFIKIRRESDYDTNLYNPSHERVNGMIAKTYSTNANTDWDASSSIWNCPKTAVYKIYAHIQFDADTHTNNGDYLKYTSIHIFKNGSRISSSAFRVRDTDQSTEDDEDDDVIRIGMSIYTIDNLVKDDYIELKFSGVTNNSERTIHIQGDSNFDQTYMIIEKLS